jgi:hypothetical protein
MFDGGDEVDNLSSHRFLGLTTTEATDNLSSHQTF